MLLEPSLPKLCRIALAVAAVGSSSLALAENHALIMTVDYRGTSSQLPGIDKDANLARKIAQAMGVPERNIQEVRNQELTHSGMGRAIRNLTDRVASGDKVFIYYSGHGTQVSASGGGNKCSEGMVSADMRVYYDSQLQNDLDTLAAKTSQVVMMNDSCFSGGQATKNLGKDKSADDFVPKFYTDQTINAASNAGGYSCGEAVNKLGRNLEVTGRRQGTNVLYIAASADNEVSGATSIGSIGTLAWASCVSSSAADTDRSGTVSGQELRACAQSWINSNRAGRQTITVIGNTRLPVYFSQTPGQQGHSPVIAANTFGDIRAASDPSHAVSLTPTKPTLRIRQDELDFSVSTNRPGYLYILQVGSDGKTFNLLFPNRHDNNQYIEAGDHRFPRETWRVRSGGPAGTSHLLAVVSPVKRNFTKDMDTSGTFASGEADSDNAKTLFSEATGATSGAGRYGASAVVQIREVN